jgi:diadenosine tetraphosphate (Ap4A) HIT family hydrolase
MSLGPPLDQANCPFCRFPSNHYLLSSTHAIAIPDGFPVSRGHTLVIPRVHVASLFDLPPDVQAELWRLVGEVRTLLLRQFQPQSFNIGLNDGPAAGQTVPHAHIHVIPRYTADVPDPRGGIRCVIPDKAAYWKPGA